MCTFRRFLFVSFIYVCCGYKPEVDTPLGRVQGYTQFALRGRRFCAFEGIPYAEKPIGNLRFEVVGPVEPWEGVLKATKPVACIQFSVGIKGVEDCLYLNIYTPCDEEIDPTKKYDVVVYIHGGGFMIGAGHSLKAKYLMDKDWIIVSFNYRLGAFGFISTGDEVLPGNYGMKDQVLALKWVQKYISCFGGNPDSVTLAGISVGGASSHFHLLSPLSKGLFKRGLSHGGSALMPSVVMDNPRNAANKIANGAGCPIHSSVALKECMKRINEELILVNYIYLMGYSLLPVSGFMPVIENGTDAFLPANPYLLLKEGQVTDVPWIYSSTTNEGVIITGVLFDEMEDVDKKWVDAASFAFDYNETLPSNRKEEVARRIKDRYLGTGKHFSQKTFDVFTQMFSDRNVLCPMETSAKLQASVCKSPVYYYIFEYSGNNRIADMVYPGINAKGTCHTEDGVYLYGYMCEYDFSEDDILIWEGLQNMLFTYASTGDVIFPGAERWDPVTKSSITHLRITSPTNLTQYSVEQICPAEFWVGLGFLENENLV